MDFEGNVWVCGNNSAGQLGLPDRRVFTNPARIPELSNICSVAAVNHSLFIDREANLYGCGPNISFVLGLGISEEGSISLRKIVNVPPVQAVSVTHNFSLVLTTSGEVWGAGMNTYNQMGSLDKKVKAWKKIPNLPKITAISAGFSHSLFLDEQGTVWGCGNNGNRRIGNDSPAGNNPKIIPNLPEIKKISAGWVHSMFLDYDNNTWVAGKNDSRQLGFPLERN